MARSDEELNKRDNKRARGKAARSRRAAQQGAADYTAASWVSLAALVISTARLSGAVRLGVTRDGGAYAIGMYLDDDYATEYIKPGEDFDAAIEEIAVAWHGDNGAAYVEEKQRIWQGTKQP